MKHFLSFLIFVFLVSAHSYADLMNLDLSLAHLKASVGQLNRKSGVREEVLRYIHENSAPRSDQEKALIQLGGDYNQALLHLDNEKTSLINAKQILKSEFCVRAVFSVNAFNYASKIHSLTLDNHDRTRLGIRLNTYIGRAIPYLPTEKDWIKNCRFRTKVTSR